MAISLAQSYYFDFNSLTDPLRILQNIDYPLSIQQPQQHLQQSQQQQSQQIYQQFNNINQQQHIGQDEEQMEYCLTSSATAPIGAVTTISTTTPHSVNGALLLSDNNLRGFTPGSATGTTNIGVPSPTYIEQNYSLVPQHHQQQQSLQHQQQQQQQQQHHQQHHQLHHQQHHQHHMQQQQLNQHHHQQQSQQQHHNNHHQMLQQHNNNNNHPNFDQVVDFVDSPPDSKEAWPNDYIKNSTMHGSALVEIQALAGHHQQQQQHSQQQTHQLQQQQQQQHHHQQQQHEHHQTTTTTVPSRKRRMDWDSLEISSNTSAGSSISSNNGGDVGDAKIPNLLNNVGHSIKDKEHRRKGRLGWSNDIDLDLSSDLTNTNYINETLLFQTFSTTSFKQELPSPTNETNNHHHNHPHQQQQQQQHHQQQQQQQQQQSQQPQHHEKLLRTNISNINNTNTIILPTINIDNKNRNTNTGRQTTANRHQTQAQQQQQQQQSAIIKSVNNINSINENSVVVVSNINNTITTTTTTNDVHQQIAQQQQQQHSPISCNGGITENNVTILDQKQHSQSQTQQQQPPQNSTSSNGGGGGGGSGNDTVNGGNNQIHQNLINQNSYGSSSGDSPSQDEGKYQPKKEINLTNDCRFQYVLAAATSIATKNNEETLTYLNQGQSYEIKLKKLGDLSPYRGRTLKSIIKICFHERRLQFMEREQMYQWQNSRPGERIVEIDVPLSYGLLNRYQPMQPHLLNTVEVIWDPMKEVGVYIKVNCISTEFTAKKHGGEKGVPFRIQVETYFETSGTSTTPPVCITGSPKALTTPTPYDLLGGQQMKPIHAAACQIKVFKLKGADRKHKQDREKICKRPTIEQQKYQPSYDCTILNDIPCDLLMQQQQQLIQTSCYSPEQQMVSPISPKSPPLQIGGRCFEGTIQINTPPTPPIITNNQQAINNNNSNTINTNTLASGNGLLCLKNPIGQNYVSSTNNNNNNNCRIVDTNLLSPQQMDVEEFPPPIITVESNSTQIAQWMIYYRLQAYTQAFINFSGSDLRRLSKDDLIQICGSADGIRMFNTLHTKAITPRLTIYIRNDTNCYHAIYLHSITTKELIKKILHLPDIMNEEQKLLQQTRNLLSPNTTPSPISSPPIIISGNSGQNNKNNTSGGITVNSGNNDSGHLFSNWTTGEGIKYSPHSTTPTVIKQQQQQQHNLINLTKYNIYISGPSGVHVLMTDEVLINIKDESLYTIDIKNEKIFLKSIYKNEI